MNLIARLKIRSKRTKNQNVKNETKTNEKKNRIENWKSFCGIFNEAPYTKIIKLGESKTNVCMQIANTFCDATDEIAVQFTAMIMI